jgi:hypothetical protein
VLKVSLNAIVDSKTEIQSSTLKTIFQVKKLELRFTKKMNVSKKQRELSTNLSTGFLV